ncbi:transposase [Clostridium sp. USBA 49]|nr:transposase [Clostridium sp. USBA 49]
MARGQKQYTEEFKNTIVELYNAGKSLSALSSEYALSKSTIAGWIKKNKPIAVDKDTTITAADYQAIIKKNKQLEEENEILKKAMGIFARK